VMHGFVGTLEQLQKYLKIGFYIGYNGIIFKKIEGINFEENIKNTPLGRILIETDCPYLTPPQFKKERNEPIAVKYIAEEIAKIKNMDYKEITTTTFQNARELFKI
jgi:TatD DNase family protein